MDYEDSRKADGIILLGYGDYELYRARLEQLIRQGTHFVRWGAVDGDSIGTTIGCDNVAGGRDAAQHLIAHGRTRIAFLGDVSGHYPELRARYRGLCEEIGRASCRARRCLSVLIFGADASLKKTRNNNHFKLNPT